MAGTPTLTDAQAQWDALVVFYEFIRRKADNDCIGLLEAIEQSAIGNYTPTGLASHAAGARSTLSSLITGARTAAGYQPMLYEYGKVIESPYADLGFVFRDIYDYNVANNIIVPSRQITFGTPAKQPGFVGDGTVTRLTKDWNDYDTEACRVETKRLVCRRDQNSGAQRHAEVFEVHGGQPSIDALELLAYGMGPLGTVVARHAGSGFGGSLLRDSSFSAFDATAGTFNGWVVTAGVVNVDPQFYRSYPGAVVDQSMLMNAGAVIHQLIETQVRTIDPNTPIFLRVMINASNAPTPGSGPFVMSLGSVNVSVPDVSALTPGWNEVLIPLDENAWLEAFNEDGLKVQFDFSGGAGTLLVDDAIFTPWDIVDGTYLIVRGGPTPFKRDDEWQWTDAPTNPATPGNTDGIRNYWTYIAGFGYLPHDNGAGGGAVTWNDPAIPA